MTGMGEEQQGSPRLSVVMSVYNGLPLVEGAIESILSQTLEDFEFIIVNDGSTDETLRYLLSMEASDARIRVIDQPNSGLTRALIRGVAEARAPLIARMDADDLSLPERFEKQLAFLDANPDMVGATCGVEYVTEQLERVVVRDCLYDTDAIPLYMALFNAIGGHGQMMYRKSSYQEAGGYDPDFRYSQDYDLWGRMLAIGTIGQTPGILYRVRIGHTSISTRHAEQQRTLAARVARRQFEQLSGHAIKDGAAELLIDLWARRDQRQVSLNRLADANWAMWKLFSCYFARYPVRRHCAEQIRVQISDMWVDTFRKTSLRSPRHFLAIARFAMGWSFWRALRAVGRRILKVAVCDRSKRVV